MFLVVSRSSSREPSFTDASDYVFGGYCLELNKKPVRGMFTPSEACQSSTFRELKAFYLLVKANIQFFCHKKVKVFADNENASRIVLFGSPKQPPQSVAIDLFQLCI